MSVRRARDSVRVCIRSIRFAIMGQLPSALPEEAASSLSALASQRVAVCMVGAVRTLILGAVHHSVRKNLLHAQLIPADLFLHLHLGWDHTAFANGMGLHGARGEQISRSDERLRKAIEHLNPVNVSLVEQSDCSSAEMRSLKVCAEIAARKRSDTGGALAGYLQYMWIARSLQTVMAHERAHSFTYAWVIRTRPDLAFFDRVPPAVTMSPHRMVLMEKESSPAYFDGFFADPTPAAGRLCRRPLRLLALGDHAAVASRVALLPVAAFTAALPVGLRTHPRGAGALRRRQHGLARLLAPLAQGDAAVHLRAAGHSLGAQRIG